MNKITRNIAALIAFGIGTTTIGFAQVTQQKIGDNPTIINPNAALQVDSATKGFLLPRLALSATNNVSPLAAHVEGMTVYNTATAGLAPNNVTPGYYYNDGSKWVRLIDAVEEADVRFVGANNHISEDAGVGANGTTMPGADNIAIGQGAMNNVSSPGTDPFGYELLGNVAIGGGNQLANITHPANVAIGYGNLTSATEGLNIAVGAQNMTAITTGTGNVAIGFNNLNTATAFTNQSIAIGHNVLTNATQGNNIGIGNDALTPLTSGRDNIAFGLAAGGSLISGLRNTFFGSQAANRDDEDGYTNGHASVFLGAYTKAKPTISYQLNIGNWIYGEEGSIALGDFYTNGLPTITPSNRLDVMTGNVRVRDITSLAGDADDLIVVADNVAATSGVLKTVPQSAIAIEPWFNMATGAKATENTQNIYQMGNVAIGSTTAPSFTVGASTIQPKLHVAGDISTTGKVWTTNSVYADYVFEKYFSGTSSINPNYEFKSLNYVKEFIKANNHLPGVESINDLKKADAGYTFDITKLTVQSLEKIEELYLHTLEQQDKIDAQQSEIESLKIKTLEVEERLQRLEKLLVKENK